MPVVLPPELEEDQDFMWDDLGAPSTPAVRPPYQWHEDPGLRAQEPWQIPPELQQIVARERLQPYDLQQGIVPFTKLGVSAQTVEDALSALSAGSPELSPEEAESVLMRQTEPGALAKTVAGVQGSVLRGAEAMTSPEMIGLTVATGVLPGMAARLASL